AGPAAAGNAPGSPVLAGETAGAPQNGGVDRQAVLAAFDEQVRRNPAPGPGGRVERDGGVVRIVDPDGWSGVIWSDLDAGSADRAIDWQLARFAGLAGWEWKHYGHDPPPHLPHPL